MPTLIRSPGRREGPQRTRKFEGGPHGAALSFFSVDIDPGRGVGLQVHPYTEIWIVQSGTVTFRTLAGTYDAGVDDIMIVEPETAHGFVATGSGPLRMMCLHDSPRIVQTFLDPADG